MAEADHPYPTGDESKAGALAAIMAIQNIEAMNERTDPDQNIEEHFRDLDEGVDGFVRAIGPLPAYQAGFIRALAEYINFSIQAGRPDTSVWRPEAAMTSAEAAARREELARDCTEMMAA